MRRSWKRTGTCTRVNGLMSVRTPHAQRRSFPSISFYVIWQHILLTRCTAARTATRNSIARTTWRITFRRTILTRRRSDAGSAGRCTAQSRDTRSTWRCTRQRRASWFVSCARKTLRAPRRFSSTWSSIRGSRPAWREKKHHCEHCDRRFYTRKDVRRHMVVHTGRKDFLCQTCGQRFGRKDHLVRHTRKSHKEDDMELRVRLGEQLQAVGVTTVQHMLGMQHLQDQPHHHQLQHPHHLQQHQHQQQQLPLHHHHHQQMSPMAQQHQQQFMYPMQQSVPQPPQATQLPPPPCTMSQPQQFTELLKIPPVPRFKSQQPKVTIKNEVHKMNDPMDLGGLDACSLGRGQMMQDTLGPGGVDLGQLLGFLPLNAMQQQQQLAPAAPPTPTSPPMSLPPNTPPATLPQSPLNIPQTQLPQQGMPTQDHHTGVINQQHIDNHMNHVQMQHMAPAQVPFSGMHSLPRFHQAFQ